VLAEEHMPVLQSDPVPAHQPETVAAVLRAVLNALKRYQQPCLIVLRTIAEQPHSPSERLAAIRAWAVTYRLPPKVQIWAAETARFWSSSPRAAAGLSFVEEFGAISSQLSPTHHFGFDPARQTEAEAIAAFTHAYRTARRSLTTTPAYQRRALNQHARWYVQARVGGERMTSLVGSRGDLSTARKAVRQIGRVLGE
jgi:hypothetical protein